MANRYWVGGAGTWDPTDTTHWSDTSGGAGGFSVPTASDDVFFDALSGFGSVGLLITLSGALTCNSLSAVGVTNAPKFAGTGTLTISGNLDLTGMGAPTCTGAWTFNATTTGHTVAFASLILTMPTTFNGAGGGWTLLDAITSTHSGSATWQHNSGTINYGSFTHTFAGRFTLRSLAPGGNVTAILNNCIIISSFTGIAFNVVQDASTTLTIPANTATFRATNPTATVSATAGAPNGIKLEWVPTAAGTLTVSDSGTDGSWASLTATGFASAASSVIVFSAGFACIGAITLNGASIAQRIRFGSDSRGTQRSVSAGSWIITGGVDFEDIVTAGTWPVDVSMIGDLGGNGGNFVARTPTDYYWRGVAVGTGSYSVGTNWSLTDGGASVGTIPLPQDRALFRTFNAGKTVTFDVARTGGEDWIGATNTPTRALTIVYTMYGSIALTSAMTLTGNFTLTMAGRGSNTIISAGKAIGNSQGITIDCLGGIGSVTMLDALTVGTAIGSNLTVTSGTFSTNNFALSFGVLSSASTNPAGNVTSDRTINLGSSVVTSRTTTGNSPNFGTSTTPGLTLNAGTSLFISQLTTGQLRLGSAMLYDIMLTGAGNITIITGTNGATFHKFINASTAARTISISPSFGKRIILTAQDGFPIGASTKLLSFVSVTPGTQWEVVSSLPQRTRYVSLTDSAATGLFWAGEGSVNGGNNTGWQFGGRAPLITRAIAQPRTTAQPRTLVSVARQPAT